MQSEDTYEQAIGDCGKEKLSFERKKSSAGLGSGRGSHQPELLGGEGTGQKTSWKKWKKWVLTFPVMWLDIQFWLSHDFDFGHEGSFVCCWHESRMWVVLLK